MPLAAAPGLVPGLDRFEVSSRSSLAGLIASFLNRDITTAVPSSC